MLASVKFVMLCERRRPELLFMGRRPPSTSSILLTLFVVVLINTGSFLGFNL